MPWTTEQKIFIVEAYFRHKSIYAAQLRFEERLGCREFPVHSMIYRSVNKFRTHGTVHNLKRKDTNRQSHSGRPKSSRSPHNVAAVRDCFSTAQGTTTRIAIWPLVKPHANYYVDIKARLLRLLNRTDCYVWLYQKNLWPFMFEMHLISGITDRWQGCEPSPCEAKCKNRTPA